jgi:ABC-type sugar transport system ATPase subunit
MKMTEQKSLLRMESITKTFFGVPALNNVSFDLREGEIHALCGENGAGKSTLMKVLAGNHQADSGDLYINDGEIEIKDALAAEKLGIAIV